MPFSMHSGLVQVSFGARRLLGLGELEEKRRTVALFDSSVTFELPFQIASNLMSRRIVLFRFVVPFFHSDSMIEHTPLPYS